METSIELVQAQDYEQKKASAMEAGQRGERVAVFTDETLLRRWIDVLAERPESPDLRRCKP